MPWTAPAMTMPAVIRHSRSLALGALALALAACAGDGPVKGVAEIAGIATTPQDPKDFVTASRPVDPEYVPISRTVAGTPLCDGDTPPAPYVASGNAARFEKPTSDRKPGQACKPRAAFKQIEAELEAKRVSTDAAGVQAKALGQVLPPPKPAEIPPTN
jgi:hypothetical protein